jgi:hypothetical protein
VQEGFFMVIDHAKIYEKRKSLMWTCVEQLTLDTHWTLFHDTCAIETLHFLNHCEFHWCHVTPLVDSMCWKDVLCKVITTFSVRNWYWIFQNLTHDHHVHGLKWFPMHPIFHLCSNFLFSTLHKRGNDVLKTEILNYGH